MANYAFSRRTLLTGAVGAGAAAALAACGGGGDSANTLVVAEWTNAAAIDQTKKVNDLFEKQHPGITVKLQSAPTAGNAWPTLQNSLLASKNVDVLAQFPPTPAAYPPASTGIKPSGTASLIASGQFVDLSDQPFMKRFDATAQRYAMGYKDGIYGVMTAEYVNNTGLWYKKDLLDKHHLAVPTTFGEFVDGLKTLKAHGLTPVYVAAKDGYQNIIWAGIINQLLMQDKPAGQAQAVYEQRAQDFWKGSQGWDSPLYRDAARRYEKVMSYIEASAAGVPAQTAPGVWATQADDYPYFVDGSYDGITITQANPKLNLGFMAIPGTDDASWNRPALAPDLSWAVPVWAKHRKLALEWLDLFTQQTQYADWIKATGSLSTEPAVPTPTLSWTDWLSTHVSKGYPNASQPWIPSGAASDAGGPDLSKMQPIGSQSPTAALSQAADAYRKSVR
jgi:raffinose/stachyose/melibiose transport system substrate-binding protein